MVTLAGVHLYNSMCITFTEASLGTSGDAVETYFGNSALSSPTLDSITHLTLQVKARMNGTEMYHKFIWVGGR